MSHSTSNQSVILFDGVCNFCNSSVNFVLDRDPRKKFLFASLQSEVAKSMLTSLGENAEELSSVVLIKNNSVYKKSSAALEIARELNGAWKAFYIFKIVPRFIRDFIYDIIARNRYKWFGKQESCRMPDPENRSRFLG